MGLELKREFHVRDDIILRTFRDGDAEAVFSAVQHNREHLKPFMEWATADYSVETAERFIENSIANVAALKGLGLGIFASGRLIGSIGFVKLDWKVGKAEIGYWIDKAEEGKGIVSASCGILLEYAFGELGMNRVEIRCSSLNIRSAQIPQRFGFTKEGVLRQSEIRDGRLHDFNIYGLLAGEWRERNL
jgi:ribosomal-protein-serine acetyltransferase